MSAKRKSTKYKYAPGERVKTFWEYDSSTRIVTIEGPYLPLWPEEMFYEVSDFNGFTALLNEENVISVITDPNDALKEIL